MRLRNEFATHSRLVEPPRWELPLVDIPDGGPAPRRVAVGVERGGECRCILRFVSGPIEDLDHAAVTPDGEGFAVSAGGAGWIGRFDTMRAKSILFDAVELHVFTAPPTLVLADYTDIVVVSRDRRARWRDVSWDGIRLVGMVGRILHGEAWSAPDSRWLPFEIDLEKHTKRGGPVVRR